LAAGRRFRGNSYFNVQEENMKLRAVMASFFLAMMIVTAPAIAGDQMVDINTATVEQLQVVSGIGEKTAMAIVAYRDEFGAFKSVDELVHVKGIGEKKLAGIRKFLQAGKQDGEQNQLD